MEMMLGTTVITNSSQRHLDKVVKVLDSFRRLSEDEFSLAVESERTRKKIIADLQRAKEVLESCVLIEETHRSIILDKEATRECRDERGKLHTIQLVFFTDLPASSITVLDKVSSQDSNYRFKARTPHPIKEATLAMQEHGHKFDRLQLWWVPNEIMVERVPDPDPVLVGVREVPRIGELYFELHRWVDESVEDGWWSKEGY